MKLSPESIQETTESNHFKIYKRYPVTLKRGRGSRVWDTEGREYIDALAGIAVNSVGHCHPDVVRSEEHTSELQSRGHLVCRPLLEKKNNNKEAHTTRKYGKESAMQTSNAHEKEEKMTPCQSPIANE